MRADLYLVEHGYFDSRAKARAAIDAGRVRANGVVVSKASKKIPADVVIHAEAAHPWVSRAALKLVAGLDNFGIDPAGRVCLDVGASTGGFTQVLLSRGQLHPSVADDPRTVGLEGQDARTLDATVIGDRPTMIVCDASFIGLAKVLERPLELAAETCDLVALIKPQFEVGRENIGKRGIVSDTAATEAAVKVQLRAATGMLNSSLPPASERLERLSNYWAGRQMPSEPWHI